MMRFWAISVSFLAVLSGCASTPKTQLPSLPPVAPVASAVPAPVAVALPPTVFSDATAVAQPVPAPQPTYYVQTAPAPVQTVAAPQPTYVAAPAQPAPVQAVQLQPVPTAAAPAQTVMLSPVPQRIEPAPVRLPRATGPRPTGAYLAKLENQGNAPDGDYGFILMDARDSTVLSEKNADTPLAPSSMGKLLATVAILETMGPNGRFKTRVLANGTVSGGVLNGDLHLVGSGDPSLLSSDLRNLAGQVASSGIRSVSGSFYFHPNAIPTASVIHNSQPSGALYNPGVGGLNLDYNEKNGVTPVSQPGRYTASAFRQFVRSAGVSLPSPQRSDGEARGNEIAGHESQPVSAILEEMFNVSRNMTAEALGAVAAAQLARKPSSLRDAAQVTGQWVQGQIGSIGGSGWSGFDFPNHSGLSTSHRATPRQMAEIARFGHRRFGSTFTNAFAIRAMTGRSGGVGYDVRSKIGTMSYVRGLAGIMNVGGRDMAFAIMAMDPARRAGNPETWMSKARKLERALMSDWIQDAKRGGTLTAGL